MKHKGRTIGIIILCAVVVLLAINWQVQPLHKLRQQDAVPTYAHIIRSGVDGRTVVKVTDPQALQALQDSARQAVPLWVGPSPRSYMLEEGDIYHVYISAGTEDLAFMTVDSKGFLSAGHARYHVFGTSWRDAVEKAFQQGTIIETHKK